MSCHASFSTGYPSHSASSSGLPIPIPIPGNDPLLAHHPLRILSALTSQVTQLMRDLEASRAENARLTRENRELRRANAASPAQGTGTAIRGATPDERDRDRDRDRDKDKNKEKKGTVRI